MRGGSSSVRTRPFSEGTAGSAVYEIVGRDEELASIRAFIGRSEGEPTAVLIDLLEDVLDDVLPSLAAPRRRALEIALLLEEADEHDAVDPGALGIATRGALQRLAEAGPLLLAIDDVQWAAAALSSALAFALRRLATV